MLPTGSPRPTSYAPSRKFPPTPSQGIRGNSLSNNRKALFCGSLALGRCFGGFALGGSPFGLSGGSGFGSLLLGDRLRTLLLHLGLGSQTCLLGSLGVGGELRLLRSDLAQLLLHPLVELGLGIRLRESALGYTAQQVLLVEYALVRKNRTAGVRGLRAFHQPIQSPFEIELDRSRIRNRVVGTQFLDELAITWRSAICGYEKDGSFSTKKKDGWEMFDAGVAAQTFQLAAHGKGIGSVVLGIFDEDYIADAIQLEAEKKISALIAVGYPAEDPNTPKRKPVSELVRFI